MIFLIFDNFIINIDVLWKKMVGICEVNELSDKGRGKLDLGRQETTYLEIQHKENETS